MSHRVVCPACGKSVRISDDFDADSVVCLACGKRFGVDLSPVAEAEETSESNAEAFEDAAAPTSDSIAFSEPAITDAPPDAALRPACRKPNTRHPHPRRSIRSLLLVGTVCLVLGGVIGALVTVGVKSRRSSGTDTGDATDPAVTRELLALKSKAESLAVDQKDLKAAHAKYRELQDQLVGKTIKDPIFWDMMERAKVDQDRIYTLLLDEQELASRQGANNGNPTTSRPDDPWEISRNVGGAASRNPDATTAPAAPANSPAGNSIAGNPAPAPSPAIGRVNPEEVEPSAATAPSKPAVASKAATPSPTTQDIAVAAAPPRPVPPPWVGEKDVTDADIGYAITRGVDNLLARFKDGQLTPPAKGTRVRHAGMNALAVYALLHAGAATKDPRLDPKGEFMGHLLEVMKKHDLDRDPADPMQPVTYARSLRAAALAFYNRPQDRDVLKEDAEWLIKAEVDGAYTYDDSFSKVAMRGPIDEFESFDDGIDSASTSAFDLFPQWESTRELLCDGLHDPRTGRELKMPRKMSKPNPQRLKLYPKNEPTNPTRPRTVAPGMGPPSNRTRPPNPGQTIVIPRDRGPTPQPDAAIAFPWDNSNSQYGLLGVWAAAETGVEVPRKYWEDVQSHWEKYQLRSGEWGYDDRDREGYLPMTCGGLASLWVTYDWLVAPKSKGLVGRPTMSDQLARGMKWLETADNSVNTPGPKSHYIGYDLFGLERVALASGFKYFGSHDWYRVLAARSVGSQFDNGAWGWEDLNNENGFIDTCYQILFLSHGRHPIFFNKLRFTNSRGEGINNNKPLPGYWANRPRDVANLTKFASRQFERAFNWQVVDLNRDWSDWLDCPVLFIASHTAPAMADADYEKFRQFTEAGGLIFTHADAGSAGFNHWVMEDLVSKAFPGRKLETLPDDHPIYSLHYDVKKNRPKLQGISNGSRLLLIHTPTDVAAVWQQRADRVAPSMYQIAANIFFYAAGKMDFRNRLDSPYIPPAKEGIAGTIGVARIKYDGNWDPEPGAWRRFANLYQWEQDMNVPVHPTEFGSLDVNETPIAHLTGIDAVEFTNDEAKAFRKYVEAGGMVLVDPCGGSPAFNISVRESLLAKAFPGVAPAIVPKDHPLITGAGADDNDPLPLRLRPYNVDKLKMAVPQLERISLGTGVVFISRVDITSGLLGTNTYTVVGYDPPFAQALVWNLLDWTQANLIAAGKMPAPK